MTDDQRLEVDALAVLAEPRPHDSTPTSTAPKRRGLRICLVAGGVAVLGLAVGIGAWAGAQAASHSPQAAVKPYLTALVHGDVTAAVKAGHITGDNPLVSTAVYAQARDRPSSIAVTSVSVSGSTAQVDVASSQNGERRIQTLTLKAQGRDELFFTKWVLQPVQLDTIEIAVDGPSDATITVNDQPLEATAGDYRVLPGSYDLSITPTDYFDGVGGTQTATASDLDATDDGTTQSVTLESELTAGGLKAADDAVSAWVTACAASTAMTPPGCSFSAIDDLQQFTVSDPKWTLNSMPTFSIGAWTGHGWAVTTTHEGSATYTADIADSAGDTGTAWTDPIPVKVEGVISGFSNGKAVFTSIDWNGSQATANA